MSVISLFEAVDCGALFDFCRELAPWCDHSVGEIVLPGISIPMFWDYV